MMHYVLLKATGAQEEREHPGKAVIEDKDFTEDGNHQGSDGASGATMQHSHMEAGRGQVSIQECSTGPGEKVGLSDCLVGPCSLIVWGDNIATVTVTIRVAAQAQVQWCVLSHTALGCFSSVTNVGQNSNQGCGTGLGAQRSISFWLVFRIFSLLVSSRTDLGFKSQKFQG